MDNITYLGIFRMFWLDLILPTLGSYIIIEIIFHLIADAIRGHQ